MDLLRRSSIREPAVWLATFLSVAAPSFAFAQDPVSAQPKRPPDADEQQFMFDNDLAISNISQTMPVKPTGDIDRDFVALMIPQHQGAIDMARAELKYGHNDGLRRLAQSIIMQQSDEVSAMRSAVGGGASTQAVSTSVSVRPSSVNK